MLENFKALVSNILKASTHARENEQLRKELAAARALNKRLMEGPTPIVTSPIVPPPGSSESSAPHQKGTTHPLAFGTVLIGLLVALTNLYTTQEKRRLKEIATKFQTADQSSKKSLKKYRSAFEKSEQDLRRARRETFDANQTLKAVHEAATKVNFFTPGGVIRMHVQEAFEKARLAAAQRKLENNEAKPAGISPSRPIA